MKKVFVAALATGAMFAVSAPAMAGDYSKAVAQAQEKVKTTDLDLATAEGRKKLDKRITKAVKRACAFDAYGQFRSVREEKECRASASARVAAHFGMENENLGG